MVSSKDRFRNVILCEDVRYEIGNKKTIVGTFSGDIIVSEFPAALQIGVYMEYLPDQKHESEEITVAMWQDDKRFGGGEIHIDAKKNETATIVLPRIIVRFEKECTFRIEASVDGGPSFDLLSKRIFKGEVAQR